MTVQIGVSVKDVAGPELARAASRVRNVRPMLDEAGAALEASTQQRFLDQESPEGKAWEKHSPATEAKRGVGQDILRESSDLLDSVSHQPDGMTRELVGANRPYARIQHLGGMAGPGRKVKIPARPYLGVSKADKAELEQIVREHLEGGP